MKNVTFYFFIGLVTLSGSSCEPEPLSDSKASQIHVSHDPIPTQLIGNYIPHVLPYTGQGEPAITVTAETVTLNLKEYTANLALSGYRVVDNPDCWITIFLNDGSELRLKYVYVKKEGWISVSIWRDGVREELGIYDKIAESQM